MFLFDLIPGQIFDSALSSFADKIKIIPIMKKENSLKFILKYLKKF